MLVGELEEKGHNGDSAETALLIHKQDVNKVSGLYLASFEVPLLCHCLFLLLNGLVSSLGSRLPQASGSV